MQSISRTVTSNQRGFTIVELLIVIVVIAILAAISITAYTGMSNRAKSVHYASVINTYDKELKMYLANHGHYPQLEPGVTSACLGSAENYPATAGFPAGACVVDEATQTVQVAISPAFNAALTEQVPRMPDPINDVTASEGGLRYRGVFITSFNTGYEIEIALPSSIACPSNMRQYALSGIHWCERAESD